MVPPVRSRAARGAVPQWRFRRNARDQEGSQALRGTKDERGPARSAREAGPGGECRRHDAGSRKDGRSEPIQWPGVPAKPVLRGNCPLSTGGKWTERPPGGLCSKGEMPPGTPRSPTQRMASAAPQPRVCRGASLFPVGDGGRKRACAVCPRSGHRR